MKGSRTSQQAQQTALGKVQGRGRAHRSEPGLGPFLVPTLPAHPADFIHRFRM